MIVSFIDDFVFIRYGEFFVCGWLIFIYCVVGIFVWGFCKGNILGVFLIGIVYVLVKRGYLFSEFGGNSIVSIVGFGLVKRDVEKCIIGIICYVWI